MFTRTAKYAIKALLHLAEAGGPRFLQGEEIARRVNVPANYLGKVLQKLAHARILDSQKGLNGGFRLARPPHRVTLHEILVAIEAVPRDFAGEKADSEHLPTRVYKQFVEISEMYYGFLKSTTLADLARHQDTPTPPISDGTPRPDRDRSAD